MNGLRDFLLSGGGFRQSSSELGDRDNVTFVDDRVRNTGVVSDPAPPIDGPHSAPSRQRSRRTRLSLAARVALAWSLGAGIITGLVGGSSYFLVRNFLIEQRENEARSQAYTNAREVRRSLQRTPKPVDALNSVRSERGSFALLFYEDDWRITERPVEVLPQPLVDHLLAGRAGNQRFTIGEDDEVWFATGVPMPAVGSIYVEAVPLTRLTSTLTNLRNSVFAGMIGALTVGAALGGWTARRVLRPVAQVAQAAEALAGGALDTRLQGEGDPDLNRVAASFNTMVDAVQRRIEREERFASDVSHELRTPLGVMSAAAQVLDRRKTEMPERAAQAVEVITGQLNKLSSMVLDLLEIARIDAGVADVHLEPCEVAALTRRIVEGNGVSQDVVDVDPSANEASALLDPRRYEQIVRNLLDNARKYGGGTTAVTVRADRRFVRVTVEDEGPGVPASERQRVFERFARGRSTHDVPGTGLGLALAADQAALLNAELSVDDRPGGGARFTIRLTRA
jgi:two-component system, OmpR family, sensor histidine kinase MtrB